MSVTSMTEFLTTIIKYYPDLRDFIFGADVANEGVNTFYAKHKSLTNFMNMIADEGRVWEYQEIWDFLAENEDKHVWWML